MEVGGRRWRQRGATGRCTRHGEDMAELGGGGTVGGLGACDNGCAAALWDAAGAHPG